MALFTVRDDRELIVSETQPLRSLFQLSPFVWRKDHGYQIVIRAVPDDPDPAKKISSIYHGRSTDGLSFAMDDVPCIAPGPEADDLGGCEDPTVAVDGDSLYIYYTGLTRDFSTGRLLLATGRDPDMLEKRGIAIDSSDRRANPKEATIARRGDGCWTLFFEYAASDRSRIGVATAEQVTGPWNVSGDPFVSREGAWDCWHLSPGPIVPFGDRALMFYNGATEEPVWRVGWVLFDKDYSRVVERCESPIFSLPAPQPGYTDIAFAASALTIGDELWLYYSVADRQMRRAILTTDTAH